ncbi:MAG: NAD(P)-dependent alcohol dehydrogenase [Anaerolineales bacterium]|nr:NAD(P)-dependent alcohol dehydrogenase [Anaerolineales bacterium]
MKAIIHTQNGPPETVLRLEELEKPVPTEQQVLVKVHAASVNAMEWRGFAMSALLLRIIGIFFKQKTQQLGTDVAGTVEAVGSQVTEFKPGDEVFGVAPGAFAEYVCNGASKFALKPTHLSFEAAASVPVAGFTALQGLRDKGQIQAKQKVLIDGASGGVGIFAVQIAKAWGAEVTGVCSTRNLEMVQSLGADQVIDYTREDFTRNGKQYDLILVVNGHHSIGAYRRALSPKGKCIVAGGPISQVVLSMILGPLVSRFGRKKYAFMGIAGSPKEDLLVLKELLETGKLAPVIDQRYPLHETAKAIRHLMEKHAQGKIIITVA